MDNLSNLIALILEICGVGFLITDELGPFAATIRQDYEKVKAKWWQKPLFYLARKFGSSDPLDRVSSIGESYPLRFLGFFFIFIGFLIQAIGLVIQINAS
ncbi:MAG: hypothetical protein V3U15_05705 [Nitrospinota bacterium]